MGQKGDARERHHTVQGRARTEKGDSEKVSAGGDSRLESRVAARRTLSSQAAVARWGRLPPACLPATKPYLNRKVGQGGLILMVGLSSTYIPPFFNVYMEGYSDE
ncbi:GL16363 [Drosophila persimilis]|uniref:GL16363 n=1 Tax=Drosophila persimilis TaxID=7234 RepID=B4ISC9_DROPE|nr:GL16363 [Drosophila persimilis]